MSRARLGQHTPSSATGQPDEMRWVAAHLEVVPEGLVRNRPLVFRVQLVVSGAKDAVGYDDDRKVLPAQRAVR